MNAVELLKAPIDTQRLRLSALPPGSLERLPWLADALAPEWRLADLWQALQTSQGVLISDKAGAGLGLAVVAPDEPRPREATIPFLTIGPERRYRGLGGEAGIALDRYLREHYGAERVFAPVPEGRGLAVYFWLRLGFRPLNAVQAPPAPLGLTSDSRPGIWLLRDTP